MSDNEPAIIVQNLHKSFKLPHEQHSGIKQRIINFFKGIKGYETQQVLKDISFEIKKGEFFGIVGRNGSGKSTLLKLLAGTYVPNSGSIQVNGSLTPFIELGVGFNPELTGRENVFLNGALLGFSKSEMELMYYSIVEFAELEKFMDQKLKNYSSGMQVRLAFSIAIRAKNDVLLLDEVLAVGDAVFQKKCYDYFKQLKKEGRTVVFVSHDTGALQEYCSNGILIEKGKIIKIDKIDKIIKTYLNILNETEKQKMEEKSSGSHWGSGEVLIESITIGEESEKLKIFNDDEAILITIVFIAKGDVEQPVYGITINDLTGQILFQSNTLWKQIDVNDMKKGERAILTLEIPNVFGEGTYLLSPAVSDKTGTIVYDWHEDMARFKITKSQKSHGVINVKHNIAVK
jgi:ABC-2 type transport system ATP-binding protein